MIDGSSLRKWPTEQVWMTFWFASALRDREAARQELLRRGIMHRILDWREQSEQTAGQTTG
jgi:hypothetical protein